jgi:hypothetical protein
LAPNDFKEIPTQHPSHLPPTYTISKEIELITREMVVLIGYLLKGLFVSFGRKARDEGIPKAIRLSYWFKNQSIILAGKLIEVGKPRAIESGRFSKGLLILTAENLKTKGVPLAIGIFHLIRGLSSQFYNKAKKVAENRVNIIKQDIATEKIRNTTVTASPPSPEIILKEEETVSLNERIAHEIAKTGISCNAVTDIRSLEIEKKQYYSYLFAMSPRIVTNRGCIRFEGNSTGNIDFIQILQKN